MNNSNDLNPEEFCARISKPGNGESTQNTRSGEEIESLCSNNLFLRQVESFLHLGNS